mgnify:FL=1
MHLGEIVVSDNNGHDMSYIEHVMPTFWPTQIIVMIKEYVMTLFEYRHFDSR